MKAKEKKQKKGKVKSKRNAKAYGYGVILTGCIPRSRAHARKRPKKADDIYIRAWREQVFANGIEDPVPAVVDEAMRTLNGDEAYRAVWTWYTVHLGVNTVLQQMYEVESAYRQHEIRWPAKAFHARLRRIYGDMEKS